MIRLPFYMYWFGGSRGATMFEWNLLTNVVKVIR